MYNFSTEYWDKQQEELQNKWRKEREEKTKTSVNKINKN
jgi:hypothetical protein